MKTLFYAVLLLSSTQVWSTTDELDFVEGSLVQREFADYDVFNATGIKLNLNKSLTERTFIEVELLTASDEAIDIDFSVSQWQVKTGYNHTLTKRLSASYSIGFGTIGFQFERGDEYAETDTTYISLNTQLQYRLFKSLVAFAGTGIQKWREGSDQKYYQIGAYRHFAQWSLGASYMKYSDSETFALSGRYRF